MNSTRHLDFHRRIPALDGLRGLAILAVFFRHYAGGLENTGSTSGLRALGMLFNFGWSGVDLFFVLSGFLITGILYDTQQKPGYFKNFYARRVLRIFPPYYLLAVVYLGLTPVLAAHWKWGQLSFLVYLGYPLALIWPSLGEVSPSVHITHVWSLCAEEQFYMIWPWILARLRTSAAILRACVVLGTLALLLRVAIWATGWVGIGWTHDFLGCRMDALAVGAAIAIAMRGPLKDRVLKWAPSVFFPAAASVILICALRRVTDHSDPVIATFGFTIIALAYGGLLLLALREGTWLERLLSLRVLRIFGKYSYAMYLFDFPLTVFLSPKRAYFIAGTHSFAIGSVVFLTFCLLVNLLVAAASFHLVESPIMRLKSRFKYASPEHLIPHTARIEIHSFETLTLTDKQFLTDGREAIPARIAGELRLPAGAARVPAVVLLHGSAGIGANVNRWAYELNKIGAAALLVDSFTGRGVVQTVTDQSQLGSLTMIVDAYRALLLLSKHPGIDATRIAVMGFSKGGFAALYAGLKRFQRIYGSPDAEFAAYVPFYPACNTTYLEDENVTQRPIRIFHGAADNYVPIEPCRKYVERLRRAGKDAELTEYAGAHHAFDNPLYLPHRSLPDALVTAHCTREERAGGEIINVATGEPFRWNDVCVKRGGTVGYDARATAEATNAVKSFLTAVFQR